MVVFPEKRPFRVRTGKGSKNGFLTFERTQLPLQPAFAITDYKSQGKTLSCAIVDLKACTGSQSPYVMVSRVTNFESLFVLRPFEHKRIRSNVNQSLRLEDLRFRELYMRTLVQTCDGRTRELASAELSRIETVRAQKRKALDESLAKSTSKRKRRSHLLRKGDLSQITKKITESFSDLDPDSDMEVDNNLQQLPVQTVPSIRPYRNSARDDFLLTGKTVTAFLEDSDSMSD